MLRVAGRIAIAIRRIAGGTTRGEFLAPRRLRILPNGGGGKTTLCGWRRIRRESASGRRRASIVVDPVDEAGRSDVRLNVLRGGDVHTLTFVHRNRGAIDAGAVAGFREGVAPGLEILVIWGRQAATFLNVQKNHGAYGKALLLG